tara:strand:+ start:14122 stop:14484 length:363 start_codon:yes stop_codon:yes gene_type:complete
MRRTYAKPNKYKAQPVELDGYKFDSKREAYRYSELKILQRHGKISNLNMQLRYPLKCGDKVLLIKSEGFPNGRRATYIADFVYEQDGETIIEDVKGMATPVYKLKKAIMEAMGYTIREIR